MGSNIMSSTGTRLTLKFNFPQQIRYCGWSESYDLGYGSLAIAIAASPAIAAFIVDRCACLGMGPVLVEAVLSGYAQPLTPGAPPVRRSTLSFPLPPTPPAGQAYNKLFPGTDTYDADYGTTVLLLSAQTSLSGVPVYNRSIWIAGLPDAADLTSNLTLTDPATAQAVAKFVGDLNNTNATLGGKNNVSIRSVDRSGANAVKPCTAWNNGPPLTFTIPAHGFASGQPIQAEGCVVAMGGTAPRGRYLVASVIDANTITIAGLTSVSIPIHTGGFRASVIAFNKIEVVQIQGMTKRNKGRPFGLSVGRRPKARTKRA
jgi:hypothetical protein